jgi:hypothetical protein
MVVPKKDIISVEYTHEGVNKTFSGPEEGGVYVRVPDADARLHPEILDLTKYGDTLNNVWVIFVEQSGDILRKGQELRARVRVGKKTGGFAIAATVTLGIVVAVKVIKRTRD